MKSLNFLFLAAFVLIFLLIFKILKARDQIKAVYLLLTKQQHSIIEKEEKIKELEADLKSKLKKARNIHRRILPDNLVEPDDYLVVDYYQPAEYIGGDAYNFFKIEHELLAPFFEQYLLYFFDVSGHGIDSTLLAIFINEAIENYFKLKHNPGEKISTRELINYIDQQYQKEDFPDDYLVCLFIGVFDHKKNTLTYSCGGFQFPLYLVQPKSDLKEIDIGGLPISSALGALTDSRAEQSFKIETNNTLVLTTDGLLEENNGQKNYNQRFKQLLVDYKFLPAPFLKDLICLDFYQFTEGKNAADDITILFLERLGAQIKEFNLNRNNFLEKKVEIIDFLSCNLAAKTQKSSLLKQIISDLLQIEPAEIKLKLIEREEILLISLEKINNNSWPRDLFSEYPHLISLTSADLKKDLNKLENFIFKKDEIYLTKNRLENKLYFMILKTNQIRN